MDESEKMDLALNSDFDPTLLSCWNDTGGSNADSRQDHSDGDGRSPQSPTSSNNTTDELNWASNPSMSRFPSFTMEDDCATHKALALGSSSDSQSAQQQDMAISKAQAAPTPAPWSTMTSQTSIQVGKPSHASATISSSSSSKTPASAPISNVGPNGRLLEARKDVKASMAVHQSTDNSTRQLHPLAISSSANCPPHVVTVTSSATGQTQIQPSPAINAMPFFPLTIANNNYSSGMSSIPNMAQIPTQITTTQMPNGLYFQQTMPTNVHQASMANSNLQTQQQAQQPQQQHQQTITATNGTSSNPPPFYLFDAPCELRANFMQSQRMHGLPVSEDTNSYHYGVAVNGFHPQMNAKFGASVSTNGSQVQLIDARTGGRKSGQVKNEREQRRAQKITELIDQLREKMEFGGWKIETKSKFHTLSSCADYVKHLVKLTKEKEEAVQKARSDLERREQKAEEEKNAQQGSRSDPESVMSSLTSTSSTGDSANSRGQNGKSNNESSSSHGNHNGNDRKRKGEDSSGDGAKKGRFLEHGDSSDSFSTDRVVTASGSSCNKESSGDNKTTERSSSDEDDNSGDSIIPSENGPAKNKGSDMKLESHLNVVIHGRNGGRTVKKLDDVTSLEQGFAVHYKEVFQHSNLPQIVATTAGRIVASNAFFLRASGVSKTAVKGYTIFSLVKADKLSNLFEIVAEALRAEPARSSDDDKSGKDSQGDSTVESVQKARGRSSTKALPCIDFPVSTPQKGNLSSMPDGLHHLFVTITLMPNSDPAKRLLHCIFTDKPGKDGSAGTISAELLSYLLKRQ